MRRNVGLSSLSQQSETLASYTNLSNAISEQQVSTLQSQMATFQSALRTFANKHRAKILSDPVFRTHFADMCNQVGVDPLGSGGRKGLWDFLGVGEWTYTLAVQVLDICLASRERNGGLIEMDEVIKGVTRLRHGNNNGDKGRNMMGKYKDTNSDSGSRTNSIGNSIASSKTTAASSQPSNAAVTSSDIERAIKALAPLGCGYSVITIGDKKLIRSIAAEFDVDSLAILECASSLGRGYLTVSLLRQWTAGKDGLQQLDTPSAQTQMQRAWPEKRAENALTQALMVDGVVWLDDQETGQLQYWVPSLFDFQDEGG